MKVTIPYQSFLLLNYLVWVGVALYIPTSYGHGFSQASLQLLSQNEKSFLEYFSLSNLLASKPISDKTRKQTVVTKKLPTKFIVSNTIPRNEFNLWIEEQKNISFVGILNNIGGIGFKNTKEVSKGAVIASPSRFKPDYFYQWTRDAALTVNSLIHYLDDAELNDSDFNLQSGIESYIENSYNIQRVPNKSGKFDDVDLDGLGEPKYLANCKPFNANWGRPQRDGPGLRSVTIMNYLNLLEKYSSDLKDKSFLQSKKFIYTEILKPDLTYVARNWHKSGFDLWEEIDSIHLFTSLTQLRSLKDGVSIAKKFNDEEFSEYLQQEFINLKSFIENDSGFVQINLPYLLETPSLVQSNKRSGLDAASLLAAIYSHEIDNPNFSADIPFDINNNYVINTLAAMVKDMKYRYPINHGRSNFENGVGVAIGRYPEDIYNGVGLGEGNPWFISTATASEIIFKLIYQLYKLNADLVIHLENKEFYQLFIDSDISNDLVLPFGSIAFKDVTQSLFDYADSFLDVIREHVDDYGHMSEQFNKYTGFMEGAEDLTWSYSATWSSFRWRAKVLDLIHSN